MASERVKPSASSAEGQRHMRTCFIVLLALVASLATPAGADRSGSTTNDEIARLYLGVFGRSPDLRGEAYWNHRANSDITTDRIAEYFVDSPEFRQRFGNDNEAILTALYNNVLGRQPDAAGFAYWQERIAGGLEVSQLVRHFTESPENLTIAASAPSRYDTRPFDGCDDPLNSYLQAYLDQMDQVVTIAVTDLRNACSYGIDEAELMTTASTFKLAVMGAMLLRAQDAGRSLTSTELAQLEGMIRFSDDLNVRPIINSMGGSNAMLRTYGARLGIHTWADSDRWGCVAWSASSAASLIEHLTVAGVGELSADSQAVALGLLTTVTTSQRWGVGDGTLSVLSATVAQKNGFAPSCTTGSRINSVGVVLDGGGEPAYSVSVYSVGWVGGSLASRQNDQPAYVVEARDHMDHIAEHIARMMTR